GFHLDDELTDIYTALGRGDPLLRNDRAVHDIACIARLKPNVSIAEATAEMNVVQGHIDQLYPDTERGLGASVLPFKGFLVADVGKTLVLLLGAVGLLLVIACSNLANLLLARSGTRAKEFAVRVALGASRAQLIRQSVTESMLLSLVGGALGLVIAYVG